ncbi:hypothetical protein [Enterococcus timonensis]|uniref:hypothetical protein n=1 Tax=Enterococcus timonensis TaxID=1852364 RepID=UPI0008D95B23|nr:hypothetical protein [Enterococcus timonensis]
MEKNLIEIWGDLVSQKDLLISIAISCLLTFGAYFLAPDDQTIKLFAGLLGAVAGFILSTIIIKPKRIVTTVPSKQEEK